MDVRVDVRKVILFIGTWLEFDDVGVLLHWTADLGDLDVCIGGRHGGSRMNAVDRLYTT